MAFADLMTQLEKKLGEVKALEDAKLKAEATAVKASTDHAKALAELEKLRGDLNEHISGVLGTNPKVRVSQ